MRLRRAVLALALALAAACPGRGAHAGPVSLEDLVQEFRLDNGLTLLVVENPESPTIGVVTAFAVGAAEERPGINGVTHILEHMLFKGTAEIGTEDWEAERPHHERIEELTWEIKNERRRGQEADETKIAALLDERDAEREAAKEYAVDNELSALYEEAGGVNINAFTSYDITAYLLALPSNRLELWMYLESERLRQPILRQFYTEVQNVMEERRLRVDADPGGMLGEKFRAVAWDAHWYGYPIGGYPSDILSVTRRETEEWFEKYYAPNQMTLVVVGDVKAKDVHRLTADYFGDLDRQDPPEPLETFDLEHNGLRRIEVEYDAEPRIMMGWHKKTLPHPDDAALRVIAEVLSGGRSSRFQKRLVEERQLAASISCDHEYPGNRWDNLFLISALPRAPHGTGEVEEAVWEELERLKTEPVGERELTKAKNRIRAARVRGLESNLGLATELAYFQAGHGGWGVLLAADAAVEQVTADEIRRVASATFRRGRTTVATLVQPAFEPDPEKTKKGLAAVSRMIEAMGGEESVGAIRSAEVSYDLTLTTPNGEMAASTRALYGVPDRVRNEFSMFGQTMVQSVDDEGIWRAAGGGVTPVEGDEAKEFRGDLQRDLFLLSFPAIADRVIVQGEGSEEGEVIEVHPQDAAPFTVRLDPTGLPASISFESSHPMTGEPAQFVETFADWREVSGVQRPHRIVTTIDGAVFAEKTVTELIINGEVAADAFARPTG